MGPIYNISTLQYPENHGSITVITLGHVLSLSLLQHTGLLHWQQAGIKAQLMHISLHRDTMETCF